MDLRLALRELSETHQLSAEARDRLLELSGLEREPGGLQRALPFGVAIVAAALAGLGVIFWIASNWDSLGRAGRFALLQCVIVVMYGGALLRPAARLPLSLLAFIATGGLFACFGQIYQTGADPWQLFALWAALGLLPCLAVRHDVLWTAWTLVAMSAISLWIHAQTGHAWRVDPDDLNYHLIGWSLALMLTFAFSPLLARQIGAGQWSLRLSLLLTTLIVSLTALGGLFSSAVAPHYWLGLVMLGAASIAFASPRLFDIFALSVVGLGLNALLVGGFARMLFSGNSSGTVMPLFLLGLTAAGMLAGTVNIILKLSRRPAPEGGAA
jgi:uncharacterized membrane protein